MTTTEPTSNTDGKDGQTERLRITRAFWLALIGLGLAGLLVMLLVLAGWDDSSDVVAVVGLFTSVLGTLVGAFFGVQVGSSGKAEAESRAQEAQLKADVFQRAADAATVKRAMSMAPSLFR